MDRIRVLFVIGSLSPGGSERQVVQLVRRIDRQRFEPSLYVVHGTGDLLKEVPEDVRVVSFWDRHKPPRLNMPGAIRRRQARDLAAELEFGRVGLICDRNFEMTLLAAAACRKRPTLRVSVVSADPIRDLAENAGRYRALKRRYLQRAYRSADRVVGVSEGVSDAVRTFYRLPRERVVTIHSFVDSERVRRLSKEYTPPFEPGRFHIVSVGRLDHQKGYSYLIAAMAELVQRHGLKQLRLWIVGRGPLQGELEELVRREGIESFVRFVGFQANPYPYMGGAHLFCLPSLYEGMPNVLEEAVACELPVLACDCPSGPAEILDGGRFGRLVPPADASALAEAIADAVRNYEDWRALTGAARDHVDRHFSLQSRVAAFEDLFQSVSSH